jgi:DNA polymerase I-like protein with 3'-5' exonuclease and polymerase domains
VALITTQEELIDLVNDYLDADEPFAFDIETMGENRSNPLVAHVVWLSLANPYRSDVIPMGHPHGELINERLAPNKKGRDRMARGIPYEDLNPKYDLSTVEMERFFHPAPEQLDRVVAMPILKALFQSHLLKVGHNIKFDLHGMGKYFVGGIDGPFFDTMIASWLFDSRRVTGKMRGIGGLSLADCLKRELGDTLEKGVGKKIEDHGFSVVAKYALLDAVATFDVYESLVRKFTPQIKWLMDLEMNVLNPVLEMEESGVYIDTDVLKDLRDEILVEIRDIEAWFKKYAGREVNLRSNAQKQELLFRPKSEGGLGLRSAKLTPGGNDKAMRGLATDIYDMSTDNSVLEAFASHPVVDKMLEYAQKAKLYGTYVQPYLGGEPLSGGAYKPSQLREHRVYGQFKQSGTESGRFSSSNPNLQNIPSRSVIGKRIRDAFVANPGEMLVVADYSQIEPRIIASLSEDPTMIASYCDGKDVYQTVADRMGVKRPDGKTLVLAIAYGVGPTKIAGDIGCTMTEARELMDYFARSFPKIPQHKRRVLSHAKRDKYSETIFGRRRYLDIDSRDEAIRAMAERQAYNHLIQGSAADIMKIALANVHASLPDEATMLMTVHDEIVVTVPYALVDEVMEIVRAEMEGACPSRHIKVPLVADVKSGYRWSDCK